MENQQKIYLLHCAKLRRYKEVSKVKFYDVKGKKPVNIPEKDVTYVTKKTKRRKVKMAKAKGPLGNMLWKVVG